PPKNLLQMKSEPKRDSYRGPLAFYLPESNSELYMGLALLRGSNVERGIQLLEKMNHPSADFAFQLASGYSAAGQNDRAVAAYLRGLTVDPEAAEAHFNAALALTKVG